MGIEIERKFLPRSDGWRKEADTGTRYKQGYLIGAQQASVRIRIEGEQAYLNIKSMTLDIQRLEFEYPVPMADANVMLMQLCSKPLIEKTRYKVRHGRRVWEVDVFEGANEGLIVAEIELAAVNETFDLPNWIGEEVSHDPRYYNVNLVQHPYSSW